MAYTKQTWANLVAGGTPLSAARLSHMEDGIEAAHLLERVLVMGKAGAVAATETDAADFLMVVPFNMTLKRIKVSRKTHGSAASVVQVRRSTDSGASYSNAFGSATFASTGLVATSDPADLDVNEGDVLNFSVATGGGSNLLVELVGVGR